MQGGAPAPALRTAVDTAGTTAAASFAPFFKRMNYSPPLPSGRGRGGLMVGAGHTTRAFRCMPPS